MTPPQDPILRAIWCVSKCRDLTHCERLALVALWRFLRNEKKQIGPALVAHFVGTTREHAKRVLRMLREKGYIGSTGKQACGTQPLASRWITSKAGLPQMGARGLGDPRAGTRRSPLIRGPGDPRSYGDQVIPARGPGATQERGPGGPTDLGVRQTDPEGRSSPKAPTSGVEQVPEEQQTQDGDDLIDVSELMTGKHSHA